MHDQSYLFDVFLLWQVNCVSCARRSPRNLNAIGIRMVNTDLYKTHELTRRTYKPAFLHQGNWLPKSKAGFYTWQVPLDRVHPPRNLQVDLACTQVWRSRTNFHQVGGLPTAVVQNKFPFSTLINIYQRNIPSGRYGGCSGGAGRA